METFPKEQSKFDKLLNERGEEGWQYVGSENLTQVEFQEDARFVETPIQTPEDIEKKYLEMAKAEDQSSNYEVELVLNTNTDKLKRLRAISSDDEFQGILDNLADAEKNYFVFVRKAAS